MKNKVTKNKGKPVIKKEVIKRLKRPIKENKIKGKVVLRNHTKHNLR